MPDSHCLHGDNCGKPSSICFHFLISQGRESTNWECLTTRVNFPSWAKRILTRLILQPFNTEFKPLSMQKLSHSPQHRRNTSTPTNQSQGNSSGGWPPPKFVPNILSFGWRLHHRLFLHLLPRCPLWNTPTSNTEHLFDKCKGIAALHLNSAPPSHPSFNLHTRTHKQLLPSLHVGLFGKPLGIQYTVAEDRMMSLTYLCDDGPFENLQEEYAFNFCGMLWIEHDCCSKDLAGPKKGRAISFALYN